MPGQPREPGPSPNQQQMERVIARLPPDVAPWAEKLVRLLDDGVRIPGTKQGIGVDPILGLLVPGAGDVVTGLGSMALLFLALRRGVPTVVLLRMVQNIAIDAGLGAVPGIGDVFDFFWRSNRRNLELIEKYRDNPQAKATAVDYLVVGLGLILALVSIALPIVIVYVLGVSLFRLLD